MQPTGFLESTAFQEENESSPLLPSPKCWACWDTISTKRNPLIRVCRGCKDIDLQYIHQECINSYISGLPLPRRPRSPRQGATLEEGLEQVFYDCTRCRDPYVVVEEEISPIWVIYDDIWLRVISIILLLGFLVMMFAFIGILTTSWDNVVILFEIWGVKITIIHLALFLTIIGMGAGFGLGATIWTSSSGKKMMVVKGITDGDDRVDGNTNGNIDRVDEHINGNTDRVDEHTHRGLTSGNSDQDEDEE